MKIAFALLLLIHGVIHLIGPAKAFGLAEMPQIRQRISRAAGALWLLAAVLYLAAAAAIFVWPRWWWAICVFAVGVSQAVIVRSWSDARYGTIVNAVALGGVALGFLHGWP